MQYIGNRKNLKHVTIKQSSNCLEKDLRYLENMLFLQDKWFLF